MISKLAYEWATGAEESPLKDVSLLFVLDMGKIDSSTKIEDAIMSQLFPEDTKIKMEHVTDYASRNSSWIMLILDGCVQTSSGIVDLCLQRGGSLMKAKPCKVLEECHIFDHNKVFVY